MSFLNSLVWSSRDCLISYSAMFYFLRSTFLVRRSTRIFHVKFVWGGPDITISGILVLFSTFAEWKKLFVGALLERADYSDFFQDR